MMEQKESIITQNHLDLLMKEDKKVETVQYSENLENLIKLTNIYELEKLANEIVEKNEERQLRSR